MARTLTQIKSDITDNIRLRLNLSSSATAEWRLWVFVCATAIYSFEVILDLFKREIETRINATHPGTLSWYTYMCYQFQNGFDLKYSNETGMLNYTTAEDAAKIIAMASVLSVDGRLLFRVAKREADKLVPLSDAERLNFQNYINAISMAGDKKSVISKNPDTVLYNITVYYDYAYSETTIRASIEAALERYRSNFDFGGIIYSQRLIDEIMHCSGVVTISLTSLECKSATDDDYTAVDISRSLDSGYFNYDTACVLNLLTINELEQ